MYEDDDLIFFNKQGQQKLPFVVVFAVSLTPIFALMLYWIWTERKHSLRT